MALIRPLNNRGLTLIEILIVSVLLSVVLGGAASLYVSGAKFLGNMRATQRTFQAPNITFITKSLEAGNTATINSANKQLDIGCDCDFDSNAGGQQNWMHLRIFNGEIRMIMDSSAGTNVNATDTVLYSNVNRPSSSFNWVNPSGQGTSNVVETIIVFTNPVMSFKTRASLTGMTKR